MQKYMLYVHEIFFKGWETVTKLLRRLKSYLYSYIAYFLKNILL